MLLVPHLSGQPVKVRPFQCMDTMKWNRDEAVRLVGELWKPVEAHGYYIALTGSVLLHGYSNNDLDLLLYPRGDLHTDYRPAVDVVTLHLKAWHRAVVEREGETLEYKLVVGLTLPDKRRVELFIPNFAFQGRLDTWETVGGGSINKK